MKRLSILFIAIIGLAGCYNNKADQVSPGTGTGGNTCDTTNVTFSGTINPILMQNCALSGCHTTADRAGGYTFQTYDGFVTAVQTGRVLGAINHQNGYVAMPQNAGKLSDCDINKITSWINKGYQNN